MGLEQRTEGKFITILGGKFCQRVPQGTPGSVSRVNKMNKTVHEKFYDSFTGRLIGIRTQDGEYGKSWIFDFKDKEEVYHLQLSYSNSFATQFLRILPNANLTKEMKVSPSTKEVDGKNKSSLFVNQDGMALKHAFTKDNPNGMPDLEEITVKGNKVWDDTKRIAFLHNMVITTIVPKLPKQEAVAVATAPSTDADFVADLTKKSDEINPADVEF